MEPGIKSADTGTESPVTTVIHHKPLPGSIDVYEAWLKEIIPAAQSFAGHQSVSVIRPHVAGGAYTNILHFDTAAHLCRWLESDTRERLMAQIKPHLSEPEGIDIKTGFEFWFTPPPSGKPAKPYKQFLITLSAIFPLTLIIPFAMRPVFDAVPYANLPGVRPFVVAVLIVALMVWVIMPRYTRALSRWLFK